MGSFSIWHWLIVLLIVGLPVALIIVTARRRRNSAGEPAGFGGWLLLLAIIQTLTPIRTLADLASSAAEYGQVMTMEGGPTVVYGEVTLTLAFAALQVAALVLMLRKSSLFPRLFFLQWVAIPIYVLLDAALVYAVLGIPPNQLFGPQDIARLTGAIVGTGLWVWYLSVSVRARNTFGSRAQLAETFA